MIPFIGGRSVSREEALQRRFEIAEEERSKHVKGKSTSGRYQMPTHFRGPKLWRRLSRRHTHKTFGRII